MSYGTGLPRLAFLHRKRVPPGSDLYEQVLDDLRQDSGRSSSSESSSASSSSSSSPSTPSPPSSDRYHVTAQAELRGCDHPGQGLEPDQSHGRANGVLKQPCPACSRPDAGRGGGDLRGKQDCVVRKDGRTGGWVKAEGEDCSSSVHICEFVEDLHIGEDRLGEDLRNSNDMGHSSSLLHHRHNRHDYLADGHHHHQHHNNHIGPHSSHLHPHTSHKRSRHESPSPLSPRREKGETNNGSSRHASDAKGTSVNRSRSVPNPTSGHVVSWSVSSGCQGHSKFFTNSDDPDDTGCQSGRPHPPLSRLYPRGSNSQRQSSHIPSSSSKDEDVGGRIGRENWKMEKPLSSGTAPRNDILPDVLLPVSRHSGGTRDRSSSGSPLTNRRRGSEEKPSRRPMDSLSPPSSMHALCADSQRSPRHSPKAHHVRLCTYGVDDDPRGAEDYDDISGNDFPALNDHFRVRSASDVSVHANRRRENSHLPLLRGRRTQQEVEVDHAHVHWADEERGSPLATSVLLSSIRPRALSHGSADMPRKTILKKPNGL